MKQFISTFEKFGFMLIDLIGWIGSVLVVVAYAMNIYKKLDSASLPYYLMNIIGSGCLIINTIYHHAFPSAVVNIIWIVIALIALARRS